MKTVNLELSKKLKEAGYPQKSEYKWAKEDYGNEYRLFREDYGIASPTADEILEQISCTVHITKMNKDNYGCHVAGHKVFNDNNIADLVANQWLYLKQQGLLKEER